MYNPDYTYNLYYFNYRYVIHTVNYLKYVAMKDSYLEAIASILKRVILGEVDTYILPTVT